MAVVEEEEAESSITLQFKNLTGRVHELVCMPSQTVGSVLDILAVEEDCPQECLMILKRPKTKLSDKEQTLAQYGIDKDMKLTLIKRLMNAITEKTMQGRWLAFFGSGSNPYIMDLQGSDLMMGQSKCLFYVTEEGFGYEWNGKPAASPDYIWVPERVGPGLSIVKTVHKVSKGICYWLREVNAKNIAECQKDWPNFNPSGDYPGWN